MPSRPGPARRARLSADTSAEIEAVQVAGWRQMSSVEVAAAVNAAWSAGMWLARQGLKDRFPQATDREIDIRLAIQLLGRDLAGRIHPDASALSEP